MSDTTENPPLTEAGRQRAENLAELLKDEKVDVIFSTRFDRNVHTVKPVADRQKVEIQEYEWHDYEPMIEKIKKEYRGQTILISGRGDNMLPMIQLLGATPPLDSLGNYEYDKLFRVKVAPEKTASVEMDIF